ncbi:MAG: transketolase [Bacilli bacterium]|nr:transketolase [Bacilli bacterium]
MAKYNEKRMVDEIRLLALDMIDNAKSGHPGIVLSAAPMIYTLFANHMVYDLKNPNWCNRDRFVLSAGHGSALLYATIYATTGDFSIEDLKKFRRINSSTPGHPELNVSKRIEATTGALGQGFATSVGMAIAEKYLESKYNTKKLTLFNYNIYCLCGDGDLMEGISYEAAALAGEYKLDNLIVLYDANKVTLDGSLDKKYNDRIADMYVALGWDVITVKDGNKIGEIDKALEAANKNKKPTLIIANTILGKYSEYENTNKIHGKLDENDLQQIREKLKWTGPFNIDESNLQKLRRIIKDRNQGVYEDWYLDYKEYISTLNDKEVEELNDYLNDEDIILNLDKVIDKEKIFIDKPMRDINYQIMNVISAFIDRFIGGSADLSSSTKTYLKNGGDFKPDNYNGKNIAFGIREHAMGAILNGIALTNFRCFGSTFLTFADYLKPAIRNAALMNLPVTYIFTHDSILIGQDGATHQPIEQIGMLRSIPNLDVYRPCDYKELIGSWNLILKNKRPATLIVSKNPTESYKYTSVEEVSLGGYVISEVKNRLDLILIASGSEVTLAMTIKKELLKSFIETRIVSMPNINDFFKQSKDYQNQVLPKGYKRMVLEFSNDPNLYRLVKDAEDIININTFGKSGTEEEILNEFELDISSIIIKIKNNL